MKGLPKEQRMGKISIAAFKPAPGKEPELRRVIADRLPLLRRHGLATDRPDILCRAADGTLISISEWAGDEAIDRAHRTPEVLALWTRFSACCEFVRLDALDESRELFATFTAIE